MTRDHRPASNKPSPFRPARGWRAEMPSAGKPPLWDLLLSGTQCTPVRAVMILSCAALAGLVASWAAPAVSASSGGDRAPANAHHLHAPAIVRKLLAAINQDRSLHGLPRLRLSLRQSLCSLRHSRHMTELRTLSHDEFPGDICVPHLWYGENVGVLPSARMGDVLALHRAMIQEGSCPHRGCPGAEKERHGHYLNLLNRRFRHVGIGIVRSRGQLWLTEDFTG